MLTNQDGEKTQPKWWCALNWYVSTLREHVPPLENHSSPPIRCPHKVGNSSNKRYFRTPETKSVMHITHVYIYIHILVYLYVRIYIYIYILCIYIYIYVCIYIHTYTIYTFEPIRDLTGRPSVPHPWQKTKWAARLSTQRTLKPSATVRTI